MSRWWGRPSTLSARLTLLVTMLAIPILIVILASYEDSVRDRRQIEVTAATQGARNGASIIDGFLRDLEGTTFATAGVLGRGTAPMDQATLGSYLGSIGKLYPEVRAYFLTDPSGRVVASASGDGIGLDLSSRPYMAALKAGADKVWSGSIAGLQSGDITVAFGRPIRSDAGAVRGYVVTAFYPERVVQLLRGDYPADARIVLIDEKGHVLYDSGQTSPASAEIDVSGAPGVREALAGTVAPIDGSATPFAGDPRFGAIVPVRHTGWALAVTRPLAGIEAELTGRLLGNTIAVLATLAVAGIVAALIAARLARPLRELSHVASAIARGERPTIPRAGGGYEVQSLSEAMHTMQAAVAKREDELRLLAAAGEALSGTLVYPEAIRRAAYVAIPAFADWSVVDVLEGTRISRAEVATADPARAEAAARLRATYPPSDPANPRGPVPRAIATGEPQLMADVTEEYLERVARHPEELALYRQLGPRSYLTVPLVLADRVIGAVTFILAESGRHYSEADTPLAQQLARRIALSIENARLYYEVQQSVKTRDDFLSAVAHELKTPLTVISASAQMMQRRARDAGDGAEPTLARIQSAVSRMTSFIEELLDLIRGQGDVSIELRRAPTDLGDLARRAVAEARELAHGQTIQLDVTEGVVGSWDGPRIERAIGNLLGNAIKYNRSDGSVRVAVGTAPGPHGAVALISVTDEGIGIPEPDRVRIFERFARGSNVAGRITGSGVGLAIVRQIVEEHGGTIDVTSVEGAGSTFTMRLPLEPVPASTG
jgi:signal transduction histidine kinase/HAMP domain-containing protein